MRGVGVEGVLRYPPCSGQRLWQDRVRAHTPRGGGVVWGSALAVFSRLHLPDYMYYNLQFKSVSLSNLCILYSRLDLADYRPYSMVACRPFLANCIIFKSMKRT